MFINIPKIKKALGLIVLAFRQYRWRFALLTILGFLSGLSAAIGIGAVIPLFEVVTEQVQDVNTVSRGIHFIFAHLHIPFEPIYLVIFIAVLFIIKALIQFASNLMRSITVAHFEEDIRNNLFSKTMQAHWSYIAGQKSGHLESIVLIDVERAATVLNYVSSIILVVTSFLMYAFVAFNISAAITIITILIGIILFLIFKPIFHKSKKLAQSYIQIYKDLSHHITEQLLGAKVIKATANEKNSIDQTKSYLSELRQAKIKSAIYRQTVVNTLEPVSFILIAILFIMTYEDPAFAITSFAVIMYLVQKMFAFIQQMQNQAHTLYELIPFLRSIVRYRSVAIASAETDTGDKPFSLQKELTFNNVSFDYEDRTTLADVSFSVPHGSTVGIMGPSGAGKTTVVDLILRLLKYQSGTITLDGVNINDIDMKEWRDNIGYVPQEVFLINDTIENNIRLYDESLSKKDIIEAAKLANIYDTIMDLPEQWDTQVGERGLKLSGGQRQRITLARALARKPKLLILDEATSAIDNESEQLIQEAIDKLHGAMTIIIIAHRTSTIENADRIIVLKDGAIGKIGTPQEVL